MGKGLPGLGHVSVPETKRCSTVAGLEPHELVTALSALRYPPALAVAASYSLMVLATVFGGCRSDQKDAQRSVSSAPPAIAPKNRSDHAEACRPSRRFAGRTPFPCTHDSQCKNCGCSPVNLEEFARVGGEAECNRFNEPPGREECIATNGAACCDGSCVLVK